MKYALIPILLIPFALAAITPVNRTLVWSEPKSEQLPDAYILYSSKTIQAPMAIWMPIVTMPAYRFADVVTNQITVNATFKDGQGWHAIVWNQDLNLQQTNTIIPNLELGMQMDMLSNQYFYMVSSNSTGLSIPSNLASSPAIPDNVGLRIK